MYGDWNPKEFMVDHRTTVLETENYCLSLHILTKFRSTVLIEILSSYNKISIIVTFEIKINKNMFYFRCFALDHKNVLVTGIIR